MTEWPPVDPTDAAAVADERDELVAAARDHAGQVAYQLARLEGGDYGQADVETDRGEWTVKYEGGDLEYLRFDPGRGDEVYVISTKQPPEPEALATAMADYDAFVAGFNDYVASLDGVLDDVSTDFPEIATTDGVVAQRDRVLGRVREVCDRIAAELQRYEGGDYGTFTERVAGTRWELKWDRDGQRNYSSTVPRSDSSSATWSLYARTNSLNFGAYSRMSAADGGSYCERRYSPFEPPTRRYDAPSRSHFSSQRVPATRSVKVP